MSLQTRRKFDRDFKIETVKLITERGMSVAQVSCDLDIHENVVQKWKSQYMNDIFHTFPGKGRLKPYDEKLRWLKRENAYLNEERDILKSLDQSPQSILMKYRFVDQCCSVFRVKKMCCVLVILRRGYYEWKKRISDVREIVGGSRLSG